jgi:hypothetical protein
MPGQTDEGSRTPMPEASHDLHPAAQPLCTTTRRDARLLPRSWTTLLPATAATPLSPLCHCRTASATCTPMTSHCCCLTAADHAAAASTRRLAATSPPSLPKPPLLVPPTPSSQQPSNNANDQAGRCHACHCHACHCHARRCHARHYPPLPTAATTHRCHRPPRRCPPRPHPPVPPAARRCHHPPLPPPHIRPPHIRPPRHCHAHRCQPATPATARQASPKGGGRGIAPSIGWRPRRPTAT